MNEKNIKRSYYIGEDLLKEWEKFHAPSKDFSPAVAAGMLFYLAADQPGLREGLRKLACRKDIKKAIEEARKLLVRAILEDETLKAIADNRDNQALLHFLGTLKDR